MGNRRNLLERLKKKSLELAVILICVAALGVGISQKEGFHMDELLSFELANARFNPWIVPTQPQGRLAKFVENEIDGDTIGETVSNLADTVRDVLQNRGYSKLLSYTADVYEEPVWIDAEQFRDYITVDAQDAFQYFSVYFNVKDDNHPPLHFMLLHTISSLFWGRISPAMGCVINLGAIVGILILLMKLGRLLAQAFGLKRVRAVGILTALLYGLSAGALATTLLIRMYGLLTLWCVALFYICVKKWLNQSFDRKNFWLIMVTMLGFWTQYFFLFYCILLIAVIAAFLFLQKRGKELFCLIRSMVIAAVVGVGAFPFAISDVFSSGRGVEALNNLTDGLTGYGTRLLAFMKILSERTYGFYFVVILVLCVIMLFVRKNAGKAEAKPAGAGAALRCMLVIPAVGYFLLAARMSPYLVDRYMMPIFPFIMLIGVLLLMKLLTAWENKITWIVVCVIVVLVQLMTLLNYDGAYLYRGYKQQEKLAEEYAQTPCICVYDGVGYYENLPEFTHYKETLLVTQEELSSRKDVDSVVELQQVMVLIKANVDLKQTVETMTEKYGFTDFKDCTEQLAGNAHGDTLLLFEK